MDNPNTFGHTKIRFRCRAWALLIRAHRTWSSALLLDWLITSDFFPSSQFSRITLHYLFIKILLNDVMLQPYTGMRYQWSLNQANLCIYSLHNLSSVSPVCNIVSFDQHLTSLPLTFGNYHSVLGFCWVSDFTCENMQHLFSCVCSVMFTKLIYAVMNDRISLLFNGWIIFICVHMPGYLYPFIILYANSTMWL